MLVRHRLKFLTRATVSMRTDQEKYSAGRIRTISLPSEQAADCGEIIHKCCHLRELELEIERRFEDLI